MQGGHAKPGAGVHLSTSFALHLRTHASSAHPDAQAPLAGRGKSQAEWGDMPERKTPRRRSSVTVGLELSGKLTWLAASRNAGKGAGDASLSAVVLDHGNDRSIHRTNSRHQRT